MRYLRHLDPELDAHADDPERISPRSLNRLRADYEDPSDFSSRRFGDAYRERVKARIVGRAATTEAPPVATGDRFWKVTRVG